MKNVINRAFMAKKKILFVLAAVCLFAASSWAQSCTYDTQDLTINFKRKPAGLLENGEFSVSATKKVHFSGGNLQYTISTGKWKIIKKPDIFHSIFMNTTAVHMTMISEK